MIMHAIYPNTAITEHQGMVINIVNPIYIVILLILSLLLMVFTLKAMLIALMDTIAPTWR
jgi:hypothetical protein